MSAKQRWEQSRVTVAQRQRDFRRVEVEVVVTEKIAAHIKLNDVVDVFFPLLKPVLTVDTEANGVVVEMIPFREQGALLTVVFELQSEHVQPGLTSQIRFQVPNDTHFRLPLSAIVKVGAGKTSVYRVSADHPITMRVRSL